MIARSLAASLVALSLALPAPVAAESGRDAARARSLALGLTALAAVALAVRAADREDEENGPRLPAACLRSFHDAGAEGPSPVVLHDAGCLEERAGSLEDLPLGCAVTLQTPGGFETGFDPRCLSREGWATG